MTFSSNSKQAISLAAVNGFLVVALGAFGAHSLEEKISAEMLDVFNTGVQYHMFHVTGFIIVGLLACFIENSFRLKICNWLLLGGVFLFSGSLYLLAITGITLFGMITPIGGVAFLAAWVLLFLEAISDRAV